MSEDTPQFVPQSESQLIDDPVKAHVMATAEDPYRVAATSSEGAKAEELKEVAGLVGEEAGRQYDHDHQENPAPDPDFDASGNFVKGSDLKVDANGREARTGASFEGSYMKGAIFSEFPKPSTPFENGRYVESFAFNPEEFDRQTEEDVKDYVKWAMRSPHWSEPDRMAESIRRTRQSRSEFRVWCEKFSGKVPRHWGDESVHAVKYDIEHQEVELDDALIDAAMQYPSRIISEGLGEHRKMTPVQLRTLLNTGNVWGRFTLNHVRNAQIKLGMDADTAYRLIPYY